MLSDEEKLEFIKINNEHKYCDKDDVDFLLNFIEKQSKEIEELKNNIHLKEVYVLKTDEYIEGIDKEELCNKKWEYKINAKIEEIIKEGNYRTADNPNGRVHFQKEITDYQIEVLQSLLEKE